MKIVISAEELSSIIADTIKKVGIKVTDDTEIRVGLAGGGDASLTEVIDTVNVEIG